MSVAPLLALALMLTFTIGLIGVGAWCLLGAAHDSLAQHVDRALDVFDTDPPIDERASNQVGTDDLEAAWALDAYQPPRHPLADSYIDPEEH